MFEYNLSLMPHIICQCGGYYHNVEPASRNWLFKMECLNCHHSIEICLYRIEEDVHGIVEKQIPILKKTKEE